MALLVGDNGTRTGVAAATNPDVGFPCGGFVASATGTATTAYMRINSVGNSTAAKVLVYSAAGSLLATATISSLATGWVSAALDSSISITSGTTYILGYCGTPDGWELQLYADTSSWNWAEDASGTYAAPPSSITPRADGAGDKNYGKPSIYLDGSTGGGATFPVPALGLKRHQQTAKRLGLFS